MIAIRPDPAALHPGRERIVKPNYIFVAVLVASIFMIGLLPRLGGAAAQNEQADLIAGAAVTSQDSRPLPVVTVIPLDSPETQPVMEETTPDESAAGNIAAAAPQDPTNASELADSAEEGLRNFVESVRNDQAGSVTGIYAPGLFGLPVTGQPAGDESTIYEDENMLTQYSTPAQYGVIAILAHNYLNSGRLLEQLSAGQEVYVVYGDGKVAPYTISTVKYYQALDPHNVRSDFRDLNGPGGEAISYNQLFDHVYTNAGQLVFQTCLKANGEWSWGRIFISADPTG